MNENAPCKDCAEKHLACHDHCDKYKAWKDRHQAQQRHLQDNKYRFGRPWSDSRERTTRSYLKFGSGGFKRGGNQ